MSINKAFVVKNGFEVSTDLILADADTRRVGIASTNPQYTLDVRGGIGATTIEVREGIVIDGSISVGSSTGEPGQFLISTGAGVTWSPLPQGSRFTQSFTASISQTVFDFTYNPSAGIDVYINGVRLTPSEYTAIDGLTVVLNVPCFGGESVDLVAYAVTGLGAGVTGITGLTILDDGEIVGLEGNIVSIDFVGAAVTSVSSGFGVTVSYDNYWNKNENSINTLLNVGIGTTDATSKLTVDGDVNISGIVTASGGFISVGNTTPIQIELNGNELVFTASGIGSTTLILF